MSQSVFHRLSVGIPPAAVPEEARPFLGALMNAPGWGVALLDPEPRLVWVNDALASLCELPPSVMVGRRPSEVWPSLAPALSSLLGRALAGEQVSDVPLTEALAPGDAPRHLSVSMVPAAHGGVPAGVVLVVRDDTERTLAEAALREREAHMRSIADVSCDGYFIHDRGVCVDANRALARLIGMAEPAELLGRNVLDWVAPEFRASAREVMEREVEAPYEVAALHRDGRRIPVEVLARTVTLQGRPVRLAAVWDVSSRKASEERTARTEHFRDQFLGVVGNDLRAPLQAIQLGTGALQRVGGLDDSQGRLVRHVAHAARRLERMIHELLDFTRARLAGGLAMHPVPTEMENVVERVADERRRSHPGRILEVVTRGDTRGHWDEDRVAQLVDNLLANALRLGPEGTPVGLKLAGTVDGVTLQVHHEGPPLSVDDPATLFEPFRRDGGGGADGLGLSLYLSRQIVLAHAGRISVESGSPAGTRFTVWLPRESPTPLGR
ncbi:PAS domain S-box protein [Myxococcaceae bacterium JPH2]|nr:PAS domain S-box protein [Myxococcaceae bacterium JPH2]